MGEEKRWEMRDIYIKWKLHKLVVVLGEWVFKKMWQICVAIG